MIVSAPTTKASERGIVPLAAYATRLTGISEQQFWGVQAYEAGDVWWTLNDRNLLARYLERAQRMIEDVLGYRLLPTFVVDEPVHMIGKPAPLRWTRVQALGAEAQSAIATGTTVTYSSNVGTVGPLAAAAVQSVDEIEVLHPGTATPITPSAITLAGGEVTIEIPRYRLVTLAAQNTDEVGLDLDNDDAFETTIDVRRVYADEDSLGNLVYPAGWDGVWPQETQAYSAELVNARSGTVLLWPVGVPPARPLELPTPLATLNYRTANACDAELIDAVIHLAHAMMPDSPTDVRCAQVLRMWELARHVSDETQRSPFGNQDGALMAYRTAWRRRAVRMV